MKKLTVTITDILKKASDSAIIEEVHRRFPLAVIWQEEDLEAAFEKNGVDFTRENIDAFMAEKRLVNTFHDRETEEGFEILDTLVWAGKYDKIFD